MGIKYKWLASQLRDEIDVSVKKCINKLPTESEIMDAYQVSRQTVRAALSVLEQEGLIERRQGSGSFITGRYKEQKQTDVAILIFEQNEYIYPMVISDIQNALSQKGFKSKVYITDNQVSVEKQILEELLKAPPRGLIVEGSKSALPNPNLTLYRKLIHKGCHIIFLHNYYREMGHVTFVKDDNAGGSRLLVQHLVKQGHTRIGGIFKIDDLQGVERYEGFMSEMYRQGLTVPDSNVFWFDTKDMDYLHRFQDSTFLKKAVQDTLKSCTAVVCYNDMIAYYLLKELRLAGYHLPEDLAITTFDNTYLSNSDLLTLTTLAHTPHAMGTTIAENMMKRLKGVAVQSVELPWTLIQKGSTSQPLT